MQRRQGEHGQSASGSEEGNKEESFFYEGHTSKESSKGIEQEDQ
jgi:hypothetical protein